MFNSFNNNCYIVPQKDMKFKVIKSLDDLRDAMEDVAKETEALLTKKVQKSQSGELIEGLTQEEQMKKDEELSKAVDKLQSEEQQ